MTTTAPAFTSAQRQRAAALYRSLIRTTRELFQGDQRALLAAHQETRNRFLAAKNERDAAKIDENLDMGEQVNYLLKHNLVQGVSEPESGSTYKLRFTEHTELGSNDTIKHTRPAPTLSEIERTKGKRGTSVRAFSTGRRVLAAAGDDSGSIPRPVPRFPGIVILSDGSAVRMTTTSPRHITRTTRDFTNHPLWNPMSGGRGEGDVDDDMGRLGWFRRRFADAGAGEAQKPSVTFDESDLSWMSGGREARPGAAIQTRKGKGKGKK